jgi:uncharacterized BrkB/YihY/UPF0761 family membrane protein
MVKENKTTNDMKKMTFYLIVILYTAFMLYEGLWSEIKARIKFNNWNIIGAHGRVTNFNLFSNAYILGLIIIIMMYFILKTCRR